MKVDVAINYYGKPYHTAVTIASLLEHSAQHIGKIFVIKEPQQPEGAEIIEGLLERYGDLIEIYTARHFFWVKNVPFNGRLTDPEILKSVRYQHAIDNTDKRYLFISHNDVKYIDDMIPVLLDAMQEGVVGAGMVGACWVCPAQKAGLCNHAKHAELDLTYEEAVALAVKYPTPRTLPQRINPDDPMPMPECKLVEHFCMIDVDICRRECIPNGDVWPFGSNNGGLDTNNGWFRGMKLKGYKFAHVEVHTLGIHAWASETRSGHQAALRPELYQLEEAVAKEWYLEHYAQD